MEPGQAFELVLEWGLVFIVGCALVGIGISFLKGE